MRRSVILAAAAAIALMSAPGGGAAPVEPLVVGWEDIFTITWQSVDRRGETAVQGTVVNTSPYTIDGLQLLLDGLDGEGRVVTQQLAWSPGVLPAFSQRAFEICVRHPARAYRVRVLAFERLEAPSRGE